MTLHGHTVSAGGVDSPLDKPISARLRLPGMRRRPAARFPRCSPSHRRSYLRPQLDRVSNDARRKSFALRASFLPLRMRRCAHPNVSPAALFMKLAACSGHSLHGSTSSRYFLSSDPQYKLLAGVSRLVCQCSFLRFCARPKQPFAPQGRSHFRIRLGAFFAPRRGTNPEFMVRENGASVLASLPTS